MFNEAVGLDPEYARAHTALGRCYIQHAQGYGGPEYFVLAERALKRALELEPTLVDARLQMVYVDLHHGDKERAHESIDALSQEAGNDPAVLFVAGMLYRLDGLYEQALAQYDRLLELNPRDIVLVSYNRGRIYTHQREPPSPSATRAFFERVRAEEQRHRAQVSGVPEAAGGDPDRHRHRARPRLPRHREQPVPGPAVRHADRRQRLASRHPPARCRPASASTTTAAPSRPRSCRCSARPLAGEEVVDMEMDIVRDGQPVATILGYAGPLLRRRRHAPRRHRRLARHHRAQARRGAGAQPRPTATRSPACPTACSSTTASSMASPRPTATGAAWPCCSWTSTASRSSTTRSATRSATACCRRWPSACAARARGRHASPAWAATSSRCCCRTSTTPADAAHVAEKVLEALRAPFRLRRARAVRHRQRRRQPVPGGRRRPRRR